VLNNGLFENYTNEYTRGNGARDNEDTRASETIQRLSTFCTLIWPVGKKKSKARCGTLASCDPHPAEEKYRAETVDIQAGNDRRRPGTGIAVGVNQTGCTVR